MCERLIKIVALTCLLLNLVSCGTREPVVIGLIAGLSDRGSDFGESVRNGVILAIEQQNARGGIDGRQIELVVRDDGQNREQAARVTREMIELRPEIIIGPVTSSMAEVVVPLINRTDLTLISPTVASTHFQGIDDNFFRVNRTTQAAAEHHAQVLYDRGTRRVSLAFDASNAAYSETWIAAFRKKFTALGGSLSSVVGYESSTLPSFADIVSKMLPGEPDSLLFVTSSLDTARLCQQAQRLAPKLALSTTEWAASGEFLTEMGGDAVEGLLIAHAYNRNDPVGYQNFHNDFKTRFQRAPGSFSLLAYDTAQVVIAALQRRQPEQSMKEALLANSPYQGLQQEIRFDRYGDTSRQVFFTEIRNGRFTQVQ